MNSNTLMQRPDLWSLKKMWLTDEEYKHALAMNNIRERQGYNILKGVSCNWKFCDYILSLIQRNQAKATIAVERHETLRKALAYDKKKANNHQLTTIN